MRGLVYFPDSESVYVLDLLARHTVIKWVPIDELDVPEPRNAINAQRLLEAIERRRRGEYEPHDFIEPD